MWQPLYPKKKEEEKSEKRKWFIHTNTLLAVVVVVSAHRLNDPGKGVFLDLAQGPADIDGDDVRLVFRRSLENLELAVHHVCSHVVALALRHALKKQLFRSIEVDEVDKQVVIVIGGHTDDIPVLALQGRAGQDNAGLALVDLAY